MSENISRVADIILDMMVNKYEAPPADVSADSEFESLGFDSLVLVEMAVDLSRELGIDVEDDELNQAGSPSKAAEMLVSKGALV
ncbi:hypothetical protein CDG81_21450 [Actinopolyspora erythraea]|uniref:Carrier domain-containing protein n=1 Tax=Actinopolyspora erythraea TaxID=414996 RepID=A0A099D9R8_9ACTN|nr:acyl carrier protein [Actinopolyspora erythraea]ASU80407.1 hypothetical protein CDG81_21450 [Actinopolyspora erythraea]KGI82918.1 hypothetical protein IL38_03435 [Actinopolyspora erythraea]